MSLDKSIKHGKEKRKPYYRSGKYDKTCRPNGSCPYCRNNRLHKHKKNDPINQIKDYEMKGGLIDGPEEEPEK